ncbi:hypothetical protein [Pseudomonas sp. PDM20]|uniref:hypothetical protein n=1 Tax=Pseudomonas sp. PDM20 TaxID=2769254 RepID=UPI001781AEC4|nr:hypothetical protein [Pseudomonas sp. PDM20]MBD9682179.1 hypothetical protein [Pseudomonas sp. PDM20]
MPGTEFQWLAVVFGMLTGLGVTRLLSGVVATLRSRATSKIDWLPLIWSASLFLMLLEYWWSTYSLKSLIHVWTYNEFLRLLVSPLLLFFSAALILPVHELKAGETHQEVFESHGHWALLGFSAYYAEYFWEAARYWDNQWFSGWGVFMVVIILLPIIAFFSSRRVHLVIATAILVIQVLGISVDFGELQDVRF